jgi:transposase
VDDKSLYAVIVGVKEPWSVEKVERRLAQGEVHIWVALPKETLWVCPECHAAASIHDHRERVWRHLDTCQYRTLVHAQVPRLACPTHGTRQVRVPWAEAGGRFTALFEALAIDWMKPAAIARVAEQLQLSWDEAAGIQARAVRRGRQCRQAAPARYLGVDETAFQRRHEYVAVVTDLERSRVLHVADDRRRESLDGCWAQWPAEHRAAIAAVAMDMWEPYLGSTRAHLPDAEGKIVFDKSTSPSTPTTRSTRSAGGSTGRSRLKANPGWSGRSTTGSGIPTGSPWPRGASSSGSRGGRSSRPGAPGP